MRKIDIYIFLISAVCCILSCSKRELDLSDSQIERGVEFVARPTNFGNVKVMTKSDPTYEFESAIYTAYFLLFDKNTKERVFFSGVDVNNGSLLQRVSTKGLESVTACFIANVKQDFAEEIKTIGELNEAVLEDIKYATYSEISHLGVPKLTVGTETKYCFPMFGTKDFDITSKQTFEVPLTRLFAKVSVELKLDVTFEGDWNAAFQTYTNYELNEYKLHNLPNKVRLVEALNSESPWKDGKDNPNVGTPSQSSDISVKIYNTSSSASGDKSYSFDCYVPEFYLNSIENPTNDQRYKPKNHPDGTYPIYLELVGQYNAYSITSTDINYKVYLGNDNVSNFSLARNTHYKNLLTIKGTTNNSKSEVEENLDHRVTTSTINNPVAKAGKSANCYVINATGVYNFPAYKGAYNDLSDAVLCNNQTASKLVILANDNSSNIELTDTVYDPERNLISFNVSKIANGNVVLGLKNKDGSLEWSWHLWFNREFNAGALGQWAQINTQDMPNGTDEMIDRNLGAAPSAQAYLAGAANGLYYKYGCRAPYFTDSRTDGNGTAYHGDDDNVSISWNSDKKAQTDPCPPGYRVPKSDVWAGNATKEHANLQLGSIGFQAFRYWNNGTGGQLEFTDDIYYPYSGYVKQVDSTYNIANEEIDPNESVFKADEYKPALSDYFSVDIRTDEIQEGDIVDETNFNQKRTLKYTNNRYTAFEYSLKYSLIQGELWCSNNKYYRFVYKTNNWNNYSIIRCQWSTQSVTRTQRRVRSWVPGYYDFKNRVWVDGHYTDYGEWQDLGGYTEGAWSTPSPIDQLETVPKMGSINNQTWRDELKSHQSNRTFSHTTAEINSFTNTPLEGYQVRCVMEKEKNQNN